MAAAAAAATTTNNNNNNDNDNNNSTASGDHSDSNTPDLKQAKRNFGGAKERIAMLVKKSKKTRRKSQTGM